jgi:cytidyltransferase-like protein
LRRFRLAVLGGTFDHLHVGHQALLAAAFRAGDRVAIGITSDRFLARHPKPIAGRIQPYTVRRRALVRWLRAQYPQRRWRVVPLENPFGGSVEPEVGVLVASAETEQGGRAVNRERRRLGRASVPIVTVPLVLADDLEPVSSRRVRSNEIWPDGRRRAPIWVALSTTDPGDREVAMRAVSRVFPRARIVDRPRSASRPRSPTGAAVAGAPTLADRVADLAIVVARRRRGGWIATERSRQFRLRPREIPGSRAADLERGLITLLRPRK